MIRKALLSGLLLMVGFASRPGEASASLNMQSSMTASCLISDCSTIRFHLQVDGDVWVDIVRLFNNSDGTVWKFAETNPLLQVLDADGNLLDWTGKLYGSELEILKGTGEYGAEPVYLDIAMSVHTGAETELRTGFLSYSGQGNTLADGTGTDVSFSGTVSPEPISMVLLGTGLAAVGGVARRRRRENEDDV